MFIVGYAGPPKVSLYTDVTLDTWRDSESVSGVAPGDRR